MKVRFVTSKIVSGALALASFAAIWVWAAFAGRAGAKVEQAPAAPQLTGVQYSSALPVPPAVANQAPAGRSAPQSNGAAAAPPRRAAVQPRPVTRTRAS